MLKGIVGVAIGCLFLAGCSCPPENSYRLRFVNDSGRRVAVVMAEPGHTLPDSLVIRPGEAYDRTNPAQAGGFFPLRATGEIKVYFGDDAKIVYTPENPRSPAYYQNYMLTQIGDRLYLATYTFTVADYEQALAAGAGI